MTAFVDRSPHWTEFVPVIIPRDFDPAELIKLLRSQPLEQTTPAADGDPGDSCGCDNCR